ncbi:VOC family protein [Actinoplanes sp. NPDC049548]|uniref:VOC family protein n=1 Tax=Actinoplanes sp. NPDC049548 TaxID=3155152 RepID=UPI003441F280
MIDPRVSVRLARPSRDLAAAARFYTDGLGLSVLWQGTGAHDIVMLGWPQASWHLELVGGAGVPEPAPTEEDLLVLYLDGPVDLQLVRRLEEAGGHRVEQGEYWDRWGVTVVDPDGYRLVLSERAWSNQ